MTYSDYSIAELIEINTQANNVLLQLKTEFPACKNEGYYKAWASEWDFWATRAEDTRDELRSRGVDVDVDHE